MAMEEAKLVPDEQIQAAQASSAEESTVGGGADGFATRGGGSSRRDPERLNSGHADIGGASDRSEGG